MHGAYNLRFIVECIIVWKVAQWCLPACVHRTCSYCSNVQRWPLSLIVGRCLLHWSVLYILGSVGNKCTVFNLSTIDNAPCSFCFVFMGPPVFATLKMCLDSQILCFGSATKPCYLMMGADVTLTLQGIKSSMLYVPSLSFEVSQFIRVSLLFITKTLNSPKCQKKVLHDHVTTTSQNIFRIGPCSV